MIDKLKPIKILVSIPAGEMRDSFFSEALSARLEQLGCVEWNTNTEQFSEEELAEKLSGVDICISAVSYTHLEDERPKYLVEGCKCLKEEIYDLD